LVFHNLLGEIVEWWEGGTPAFVAHINSSRLHQLDRSGVVAGLLLLGEVSLSSSAPSGVGSLGGGFTSLSVVTVTGN